MITSGDAVTCPFPVAFKNNALFVVTVPHGTTNSDTMDYNEFSISSLSMNSFSIPRWYAHFARAWAAFGV